MPRYDFVCSQCNEKFEKQVSSVDEHVICPQCNQEAKRQFPTGTTFILKGKGWYATDYGDKT